MRLLLDTHAVLWWFLDHPALSAAARTAIEDDSAEIFVSAVSGIEIAIKHRIGKLPAAGNLVARFEEMLNDEGFRALAISLPHAVTAGRLAIQHRDPFDRVLIAQGLLEHLTLVSNERLFDETGVSRLW